MGYKFNPISGNFDLSGDSRVNDIQTALAKTPEWHHYTLVFPIGTHEEQDPYFDFHDTGCTLNQGDLLLKMIITFEPENFNDITAFPNMDITRGQTVDYITNGQGNDVSGAPFQVTEQNFGNIDTTPMTIYVTPNGEYAAATGGVTEARVVFGFEILRNQL